MHRSCCRTGSAPLAVQQPSPHKGGPGTLWQAQQVNEQPDRSFLTHAWCLCTVQVSLSCSWHGLYASADWLPCSHRCNRECGLPGCSVRPASQQQHLTCTVDALHLLCPLTDALHPGWHNRQPDGGLWRQSSHACAGVQYCLPGCAVHHSLSGQKHGLDISLCLSEPNWTSYMSALPRQWYCSNVDDDEHRRRPFSVILNPIAAKTAPDVHQ